MSYLYKVLNQFEARMIRSKQSKYPSRNQNYVDFVPPNLRTDRVMEGSDLYNWGFTKKGVFVQDYVKTYQILKTRGVDIIRIAK
jgi:hypothetical protein